MGADVKLSLQLQDSVTGLAQLRGQSGALGCGVDARLLGRLALQRQVSTLDDDGGV
jgi:hypothetical protein